MYHLHRFHVKVWIHWWLRWTDVGRECAVSRHIWLRHCWDLLEVNLGWTTDIHGWNFVIHHRWEWRWCDLFRSIVYRFWILFIGFYILWRRGGWNLFSGSWRCACQSSTSARKLLGFFRTSHPSKVHGTWCVNAFKLFLFKAFSKMIHFRTLPTSLRWHLFGFWCFFLLNWVFFLLCFC